MNGVGAMMRLDPSTQSQHELFTQESGEEAMTTHACGNATRHTSRIGCCGACHRLFSSDSAFEKHRFRGGCFNPETMERHGAPVFKPKPSRTAPGETIWALARTDERFSA